HPAHVCARDYPAVHADADEATRKLVHDHEHPVGLEHDGFAAKEVHTPQAIGGVSDERQPRRSAPARCRTIVFGQDAVHDVLIDVDAERARDDVRNPWTAKSRIARLELNDSLDECLAWALGAWLPEARVRGEQSMVLATHQRGLKRQERRRAHGDGELAEAA